MPMLLLRYYNCILKNNALFQIFSLTILSNNTLEFGFGDLDLKKGVDHDLKLEKGEVWNKI